MRIGEQYGFTAREADNLESLWCRMIRDNCTWGNLEEFVAWVATVEYGKRMFVHRKREEEPHGPDNTYFSKVMHETAFDKQQREIRTGYCQNCTRAACEGRGNGCKRWRVWFVQNWNRNISTNPAARIPVPEPTYWKYEHPDRVRELMGNG